MGKVQKLKKYKKEAQRKVEAVFKTTIKPMPRFFLSRWLYKIAWKIIMK